MTPGGARPLLVADHTGRLHAAAAACGAVLFAGDVLEALQLARARRPAAVVIHAGFPPEGGISLATRLAPLELPTVLVVATADVAVLRAALRSGVRTVLDLAAVDGHLAGALEAAVRGELFLGPGPARDLPALAADDDGGELRDPFPQLSRRERDVLAQLATGGDAGRIATRLGVSAKTVRNQLARIQRKVGAANRADAARLARGAGLGRRPPR